MNRRCARNDLHGPHPFEYRAGGEVRQFTCPGWSGEIEKTPAQRRIEAADEALANVRGLTNEAVQLMLTPNWAANKSVELNVRFRVALVEANATAALAYAISETGSDIELALSKLASALEGVSFGD